MGGSAGKVDSITGVGTIAQSVSSFLALFQRQHKCSFLGVSPKSAMFLSVSVCFDRVCCVICMCSVIDSDSRGQDTFCFCFFYGWSESPRNAFCNVQVLGFDYNLRLFVYTIWVSHAIPDSFL